MIWFFIWLAFTLFIVWLFARSMRTVLKQQRVWGAFARKHNLLYQRPRWYSAPMVEGEIKGRRVRLYVEEVVDPTRRLREFRTTTEIYFDGGFPTGIAIGSRTYQPMLQEIENVQVVRLPVETAFIGVLALARDPAVFEAYITPRMDALTALFDIKKAERLLMGHENDGFLVVQGADTLEDPKDLNARMKTLFALADALDPLKGPSPLPAPDAGEAAEEPATDMNTETTTNDTKEDETV